DADVDEYPVANIPGNDILADRIVGAGDLDAVLAEIFDDESGHDALGSLQQQAIATAAGIRSIQRYQLRGVAAASLAQAIDVHLGRDRGQSALDGDCLRASDRSNIEIDLAAWVGIGKSDRIAQRRLALDGTVRVIR